MTNQTIPKGSGTTSLLSIALLALLSFAIGCQDQSSPEGVTRSFWKAVQERDKPTVSSLVTEEARLAIESATISDVKLDIVTIEVGDAVIDGERARCRTDLTMKAGVAVRLDTRLVRESDGWKVDPKGSALDIGEILSGSIQSIAGRAADLLEDALKKGLEGIGDALKRGIDSLPK